MPPKKKGGPEFEYPKVDKQPHKLARNGLLEELEKLSENKELGDLNAKDENGVSMLNWTVKYGHEEVARWLLEKGADVESAGFGGLRGLHIASANFKENLVALLLEHNADPNSLDDQGNTAMHWGCARGILNIAM